MSGFWRRFLWAILLLGMTLIPLKLASAHSLAQDGRISAFLHIEPDDKPLLGQVNTIHFYFNDQDFRFTMEGCDCKIKFSEGKKALYNGALPAIATRTGQLKVLLPDNNVSYKVTISGTPKSAGFFQPFRLNFAINVGHPPPDPPPSHTMEYLAITAAAILTIGGIMFYMHKSKVFKA